MAGEGAAVGALGLELGFGTLGAGPFGLGERVCRGELGLVVLAEGVTFAGSVGAELGCLVAGVGLGLAGAAGLGAGSVPGCPITTLSVKGDVFYADRWKTW